MNFENGTINFAIYEEDTEFYGMAEVTLPEIASTTEEMLGSGMSGKINSVFIGHIEAMTMSLNFRAITSKTIKLVEPRYHKIEMRASQQETDNTTGVYVNKSVKHIMTVMPTKFSPGKLAVASSADASCEFSVIYYATFIDGQKVLEIDPTNFIYLVNGVDYLAEVRKALGK